MFYVAIDRKTKELLIELARQERRRPADQAAILLERAIREQVEENSRQPEPSRVA